MLIYNWDQLSFRIHVSTGELVGVLYKSFLLHVHQDPLTAHRTDVVVQAPAGHAPLVVVLKNTHTFLFRGMILL